MQGHFEHLFAFTCVSSEQSSLIPHLIFVGVWPKFPQNVSVLTGHVLNFPSLPQHASLLPAFSLCLEIGKSNCPVPVNLELDREVSFPEPPAGWQALLSERQSAFLGETDSVSRLPQKPSGCCNPVGTSLPQTPDRCYTPCTAAGSRVRCQPRQSHASVRLSGRAGVSSSRSPKRRFLLVRCCMPGSTSLGTGG